MSVYIGKTSVQLESVTDSLNRQRIEDIIKKYYAPKIGDVKYLARPGARLVDVDIESPDFDGWVYADGREYSADVMYFPSAGEIFNKGQPKFNVPDLKKFLKPGSISDNMRVINAYCGLLAHYHKVNTTLKWETDSVLSTAFCIYQSEQPHSATMHGSSKTYEVTPSNYEQLYDSTKSNYNDIPVFHGGGDVSDYDHQVMADLNIPTSVSFESLPTGYSGNEKLDAYPAHVQLQVMIFIGKRGW